MWFDSSGLGSKGRSRLSCSPSWLQFTRPGITRKRRGIRVGSDAATFVGKPNAGVNFYMILKSRLFSREPVLVPVQALAKMAHDAATEVKAPVGPPSITQQAWADARMQLEGEGGIADAAPLSTDDQSRIELEARTTGRVLPVGPAATASAVPGPSHRHMLEHDEPEMRGHYEDVRRDQARSDRRLARSTANCSHPTSS